MNKFHQSLKLYATVTKYVVVPFDFIGLVAGRKGSKKERKKG